MYANVEERDPETLKNMENRRGETYGVALLKLGNQTDMIDFVLALAYNTDKAVYDAEKNVFSSLMLYQTKEDYNNHNGIDISFKQDYDGEAKSSVGDAEKEAQLQLKAGELPDTPPKAAWGFI